MRIQQQPHIRTETEILDLLFQHNHIFQGNPDTPQVERITAASSKFFSRPPFFPYIFIAITRLHLENGTSLVINLRKPPAKNPRIAGLCPAPTKGLSPFGNPN